MLEDEVFRQGQAIENLMDELKKISRVNNPDATILVVDTLTGTDVVSQVKEFDKAIAIDGLILTKVDVDEKGGAFLSAVYTSKKPVPKSSLIL